MQLWLLSCSMLLKARGFLLMSKVMATVPRLPVGVRRLLWHHSGPAPTDGAAHCPAFCPRCWLGAKRLPRVVPTRSGFAPAFHHVLVPPRCARRFARVQRRCAVREKRYHPVAAFVGAGCGCRREVGVCPLGVASLYHRALGHVAHRAQGGQLAWSEWLWLRARLVGRRRAWRQRGAGWRQRFFLWRYSFHLLRGLLLRQERFLLP